MTSISSTSLSGSTHSRSSATKSSSGHGKSGSGAQTPPTTLISQRAIETSYTSAKAGAEIGLSGAAMIGDSLSSMAQITSTSNSADSLDLFGTGRTDLFGVGSNIDLFV